MMLENSKILALSQEDGEKEWELEGLLEQQDIGGTAREV